MEYLIVLIWPIIATIGSPMNTGRIPNHSQFAHKFINGAKSFAKVKAGALNIELPEAT